ncbi:hypothetical protein CDD81_6424 [Ophiocordyceps australis]|uniref:Secreted protein n=1 Tax=Ophiocordyceps australis TaxID=1399860 RepID=A0A2C5X9G3_9HYPO|nr:hypothetical protein CDD81_6424 [Ophiocordyceps australis]
MAKVQYLALLALAGRAKAGSRERRQTQVAQSTWYAAAASSTAPSVPCFVTGRLSPLPVCLLQQRLPRRLRVLTASPMTKQVLLLRRDNGSANGSRTRRPTNSMSPPSAISYSERSGLLRHDSILEHLVSNERAHGFLVPSDAP